MMNIQDWLSEDRVHELLGAVEEVVSKVSARDPVLWRQVRLPLAKLRYDLAYMLPPEQRPPLDPPFRDWPL